MPGKSALIRGPAGSTFHALRCILILFSADPSRGAAAPCAGGTSERTTDRGCACGAASFNRVQNVPEAVRVDRTAFVDLSKYHLPIASVVLPLCFRDPRPPDCASS